MIVRVEDKELDAMRNVKSFTDSNGGVMEYTYDKNGNLLIVTDLKETITREYYPVWI